MREPYAVTGRAFVTGIGGQDGSYLAERLVADGLEVHGLTRGDERPAYCPAGVVLHTGDVTDHGATRRLLLELAPSEVYNLAAVSSVARSWAEPDLVRAVNADAAVALLDSALALQDAVGRPVRFLQASSAEIFGSPRECPQSESTPIAPSNPYGDAKAVAHLAVAAARERGLPAVSAILYNHESPRRPTTFVTRKITVGVAAIARGLRHAGGAAKEPGGDAGQPALAARQPGGVAGQPGGGDRLVLGNLDARRDWGWAPDHVDAMVRAVRHEDASDYVIATGVSHSVRDFVAAAFERAGVTDWEPLVEVDPALVRPTDAVELRGDASRAREVLGWAPTRTFTEVVHAMVDADLAR